MALSSSIRLTSPDKLLWPRPPVSKQDLRDYYVAAAGRLMPFIAGRPLSLIRAPDGIGAEVFFQRHAMKGMSKLIRTVKIRGERKPYLMVTDADALPALAQIATVELHPWASTADHLEQPDYLTFDLDPDKGLSFVALRNAAFDLRAVLRRLELEAFLKLTGGKGLHVVVPLRPAAEWEQAKDFARGVAEAMAAMWPDSYTTNVRKARRQGRVFIDYLRNSRTATAVAAWSPRGRDGAPLAVPVAWSAIERKRVLPRFTLDKAAAAFRAADAWQDFDQARRKLPPAAVLEKL